MGSFYSSQNKVLLRIQYFLLLNVYKIHTLTGALNTDRWYLCVCLIRVGAVA